MGPTRVYDQEKHPALGQSPREAWESGLDLGGPREHRRIRYDDVFRVLTLPGSPRETALVYRNHGIQFLQTGPGCPALLSRGGMGLPFFG